MADPIDPELLETAVRIANLAAEVTLFHYRHPELDIDHKGDGTPVTPARTGRVWRLNSSPIWTSSAVTTTAPPTMVRPDGTSE